MLSFVPFNQSLLWGGRKLAEVFGRTLPEGPVGEAWELVELPEWENVVAEGPHKGKRLGEMWRSGALGGAGKGKFPFLLKWIDAADTLSVQVHPDEAACARMGRGQPKTEAWYVAQKEAGATLLMGHHAGLDAATLRTAAQGNTLKKWLYETEPAVGDMFLIKAGTIHAIGAGLLLLEVQQPSDTTYRINDWGRVGKDGKPRQLHLDEAEACIAYDRVGPALAERRGVSGPCFRMQPLSQGARVSQKGLRVFVADRGEATLGTKGGPVQLRFGDVRVAEPNDGEVAVERGHVVLVTEPGMQGPEVAHSDG